MQSQIFGAPSFSYIQVTLNPGESVVAEPDAMSSMAVGIEMTTKFNGGFFKALLKRFFGGESLLVNVFTNKTDKPQNITLVQSYPGQLLEHELHGESLCLQPGAYVCSTPGVSFGVRWAGFASWFAKEGLFKLVVSGEGKLWYGAYGGLLEKEVKGSLLVDTAHLVAYPPHMKLKLKLAGGLFSSFFSGEGFVTRVEGDGKIVIQTRSLTGLRDWLNPKLMG